MHNTRLVQVVDSRNHLSDVLPGFRFVQPLPAADAGHEITTTAVLRHDVVAVLRLQGLEELNDVVMTNLLQQATLAPHVPTHVGIFLSLLLIDDLDGHLWKKVDYQVMTLDDDRR